MRENEKFYKCPGANSGIGRALNTGEELWACSVARCVYFSKITIIKRRGDILSQTPEVGRRGSPHSKKNSPGAKPRGILSCLFVSVVGTALPDFQSPVLNPENNPIIIVDADAPEAAQAVL